MAKPVQIRKQAQQWMGQPVCVTLHDGRSYVGWITGLEKERLTLSVYRKPGKSGKGRSSRSQKASVSGFMPLLGSLFGGGAGAGAAGAGAAGAAGAGAGGLGGIFGMIQKAMPLMQMGFRMIRTIRPLFGGMKGLFGK